MAVCLAIAQKQGRLVCNMTPSEGGFNNEN